MKLASIKPNELAVVNDDTSDKLTLSGFLGYKKV